MNGLRALGARLWPRRLKHQLELAVSLLLCLTLLLLSGLFARQQSAQALAGFQEQAASLARNLALASEGAIAADELDVIEQLILRATEFPQVREIAVFNARGAVLGRAQRDAQGRVRIVHGAPGARETVPAVAAPELRTDTAAGRVLVQQPIVAGALLGWVRVDCGTEALVAMQRGIVGHTLLTGLLAGVLSLLVLKALLRRPLQALERARDFAQALERTDGRQLPPSRGPQETQALGQALNQASTRLFEMRRAVDASLTKLRAHEAALADSNEQLRTIFALSPDALVSFDARGHVVYANAAFQRLTGLPGAAVVGQALEVLDQALHARSAPGQSFSLQACFPAAAGQRLRLTLAQPRHTVLEVVGLRSDSPSVSRLLYLRDITHESEVERLKSEFLSTAAHELRTPMTSIHACVELLITRDYAPERRRQLMEIMQRQSTAMVSVVDSLLDLARIEARRGEDLELQHADLGAVVAQAVHDCVPPQGRAAPVLEKAARELPVLLDAGKMQQVVRNLLSNAYKYSHEGAVQVRLLAGTGPLGTPRVGVQVQDRGIGMTPEQLARVGERFYRADASGHLPGTGLGMSIVKEIVGLLGGALEVSSEPGMGTTVTVWLPASEAGPTLPQPMLDALAS